MPRLERVITTSLSLCVAFSLFRREEGFIMRTTPQFLHNIIVSQISERIMDSTDSMISFKGHLKLSLHTRLTTRPVACSCLKVGSRGYSDEKAYDLTTIQL